MDSMRNGFSRLYFNSRPHGGRLIVTLIMTFQYCISTHALTEGDLFSFDLLIVIDLFQLTPSRRATNQQNSQ